MILDSTQPSLLRRRWLWGWLLIIPYLASFLWLNIGIILVPLVISAAPLGIAKLLGNPVHSEPIVWLSHLIFWPVYLGALIGAKRLNVLALRIIFVALAAAIVCTCYGCATYHFSPLQGWTEVGSSSVVSPPEAVKRDALDYFHSLPDHPDATVQADSFLLTYWKDGTGQHAVVLESPRDGERWCYAVIYDQNNRRVKTLRYSTGFYMC